MDYTGTSIESAVNRDARIHVYRLWGPSAVDNGPLLVRFFTRVTCWVAYQHLQLFIPHVLIRQTERCASAESTKRPNIDGYIDGRTAAACEVITDGVAVM